MSDSWPAKPVGPRITELRKSTLPAGLADDQGTFPFYCSSPQVRRIDRANATAPAILMGTGGVATVHLGQGAFSYSTDTWAFTVSDPWTDLAFLYRQLEHRLAQIDYAGFGGSGLRHLDKEYIRHLSLPVPSLEEQELTARILSVIDNAIQQTESIIAKLKAVKQGLLHDLLTHGIDVNGQLRPEPLNAPHLYRSTPLGVLPKDWELKTGADVCREIVVGIVIRPAKYYQSQGVPVFRSANVRENRLSLADLVFMSERNHQLLGKSAVRPGDVLTVRTGYPGTSCVVDSSISEANCVDIIISRPRDDLNPYFWSLWINSHLGKAQVLAAQGGLAQQHFNVGDLQKLLIAMPSCAEQTEIARRVMAADERVDAEGEALIRLGCLKRGLMDDLLTGRVRVTSLPPEPPQDGSN